jgi:hypothetical protein
MASNALLPFGSVAVSYLMADISPSCGSAEPIPSLSQHSLWPTMCEIALQTALSLQANTQAVSVVCRNRSKSLPG